MLNFDINSLPTPCYVIDKAKLENNLRLLKSIQDQTGCKILLAQKAFSMYSLYPFIGQYLAGTTASSLHEARLGHEEMGGETHIFSAAYREDEFEDILAYCDHIVFNSFSQWEKYRAAVKLCGREIECGIRVNPEYSEQKHAIYDPCAPGSRLGVTASNFEPESLCGIGGLHFHTLCEQGADALKHTALAFEEKFGKYLYDMKWVNFGGGHHITKPGYDVDTLIGVINHFKEKYGVDVYLEPGEAVVLDAGYLVAQVLDVAHNGIDTAILDTSAACHMPDVLEMPYRPPVLGGQDAGKTPYTYRLAGPTCLAGDVIGDYSFNAPLSPGDRVVFCDMALYTMVKNNTFNGINLPSILVAEPDGSIKTIKSFGYEDFKRRL